MTPNVAKAMFHEVTEGLVVLFVLVAVVVVMVAPYNPTVIPKMIHTAKMGFRMVIVIVVVVVDAIAMVAVGVVVTTTSGQRSSKSYGK